MTLQLAVAGGGIGGLAAAIAGVRAGCHVRVYERAAEFAEIGAGIQLGPNVTRLLQAWGLGDALQQVAASPERLVVRSAQSGELLAQMPLGAAIASQYGAPYVTLHRADLHRLLLDTLAAQSDVVMQTGRPIQGFSDTTDGVILRLPDQIETECDALIGADGLWSAVRAQLLADGPPRRTGHVAYRALIDQSTLPESLRSHDVCVWLGPRTHVVHYPVRGGRQLNLVAFVEADGQPAIDEPAADAAGGRWDEPAKAADLLARVGACCTDLRARLEPAAAWRLWVLFDRMVMQGASEHATGRVALLGDAAHPMRPYLAQGAGMAIEDAAELGHVLAQARLASFDVPALLQRYALNRWQRNARVQARALRNGEVFHAHGALRWSRDAALKMLGHRLLDIPWLYGARLCGS